MIALGGVAKKSPFVMQVVADVLNVPIKVARPDQACALGSAMMAAVASGVYKTTSEAQQKMGGGVETEYLPIPENVKKYESGLIARYKLAGQLVLGAAFALYLYHYHAGSLEITSLNIPFFRQLLLNLKWFFVPFVVFMVVATSNGTNLTDGLDGLAAGTSAVVFLGLAVMAYLKGNFIFADYLLLDYIPQVAELTVFMSALLGGLMGFLWFNCKPAQIFMGDTGSLALGGLMAIIAVMLREEIFLAIIGGVFVIETLAVMAQVLSFRLTGHRILRMAPLHHHYELKGWSEWRVVIVFWGIAVLMALGGVLIFNFRLA